MDAASSSIRNHPALTADPSYVDLFGQTPHFEQSFSGGGGKTWEVNWITDQTRVKDESDKALNSAAFPIEDRMIGKRLIQF
jgi:hypothetical protein